MNPSKHIHACQQSAVDGRSGANPRSGPGRLPARSCACEIGRRRPLAARRHPNRDRLPAAATVMTAATAAVTGAFAEPAGTAVARPATAATALGTEAVGAVHRLVTARLKRHARLIATGGAGRREHLTGAASIPTTAAAAAITAAALTTLSASRRPASRAATRLVGETLRGVKLLLTGREGELRTAVRTGQTLVVKRHSMTPFCFDPRPGRPERPGLPSVIERLVEGSARFPQALAGCRLRSAPGS